MNLNDIMEEIIEFRLGLDTMHLQEYYEGIKRVLTKKTLKTFSQYVPYEFEDTYYVTNEINPNIPCLYDEVEESSGFFRYKIYHPALADNKLDVLSVISVKTNDGFISPMGRSRSNSFDLMGMLTYSVESDIRSHMGFKYRRWDFVPKNTLKLRGYSNKEILLKLKIRYPNFSTIPEGYSEVFHELAELDVQAYLYNKLKYIDELETPLGNISLKIDEWADAKERRKEFLEELEPEKLRQNLSAIGRYDFRN